MRCVSVALMLFMVASCSRDDASVPSPTLATSSTEPFAVLEALEHDCLQYPVGETEDGVDRWHADFVYFYLVEEASQELYIAEDGQPLASGFLFHEVIALMEEQPEILGTVWIYRVQRIVQHVRDGQVVREAPYVTVDDADVWELIGKDRQTRSDETVVLPEVRR